MRGWGVRIQVGRTNLSVCLWPFDWAVDTSLMSPRLYGFGVWITKDVWA